MDYKSSEQMLDVLEHFIRQKVKNKSVEQLVGFARRYFTYAAFEEIEHRSIEDLYGAVLSQWNQFLELTPGKAKVHVYNPSVEEHSWQSPHTVIDIVLADRAFILQ